MSTDTKPFVAPKTRVGDDVIFWSSWPKRNGQDHVGKVTRVAPNGMLSIYFVTAQGPRYVESVPHIDDPMLEENPERWTFGGWSLAPASERVVALEAQITALREEMQAELDSLAEAIRELANHKTDKAHDALAARQASAQRARQARLDRVAEKKALATNAALHSEEGAAN